MKTKKFSALQLNKKAVAKLSDGQLTSVKGGKASLPVDSSAGDCKTFTSTIIIKG